VITSSDLEEKWHSCSNISTSYGLRLRHIRRAQVRVVSCVIYSWVITALEFLHMSLGFNCFLLLSDEQGGVGGHKMHIFTANIATFHSRYRRKVLITKEFHKFCWSTISGTLDEGKASYGAKPMHIFNISKIRYGHGEYDTRGWCGTKPGPNRTQVALAGQPGVGAFSNSTLPMCQGGSVHGVSNAQSRCGDKTWLPGHPSWPGGLTCAPPQAPFSAEALT
jgi:hypothetical protein